MNTYEHPQAWVASPMVVGAPALQQTAAPHLHPGEALLGVFTVDLDPLLPLYFHSEAFKHQVALIPVRLFWDIVRGILTGIWYVIAPKWLVELFGTGVRYRRRYGLNPFRRLYRTIRRPLHGGSWSGGKASMAGHVWKAVRTTPSKYLRVRHAYFTLVLTDRRMLILSREAHSPDKPYDALPLLELPRGTYGLRREVPGSWWTYRLDLGFSDGSWIALDVHEKFFRYLRNDATEKVKQLSTLLG